MHLSRTRYELITDMGGITSCQCYIYWWTCRALFRRVSRSKQAPASNKGTGKHHKNWWSCSYNAIDNTHFDDYKRIWTLFYHIDSESWGNFFPTQLGPTTRYFAYILTKYEKRCWPIGKCKMLLTHRRFYAGIDMNEKRTMCVRNINVNRSCKISACGW